MSLYVKKGVEIRDEYENEISKILKENNYFDMCKKGIKSIQIKSANKYWVSFDWLKKQLNN